MTRAEFEKYSHTDDGRKYIREYFLPFDIGQGYGYKQHNYNFTAGDPDEIIYIPELAYEDSELPKGYTAQDFINIFGGDLEMAEWLFKEVDWQHPDTLLEDMCACGVIQYFEQSHRYVWG